MGGDAEDPDPVARVVDGIAFAAGFAPAPFAGTPIRTRSATGSR
jgi:hypothetical protein